MQGQPFKVLTNDRAYLTPGPATVVALPADRLHLFGADAELPVPRRVVQLAKQYGLMLHAHSDADAIDRLFQQYPEARILWAHAGFEQPERVRAMLRKHANLWADLAFRSDQGSGGKVSPEWRAAFTESRPPAVNAVP